MTPMVKLLAKSIKTTFPMAVINHFFMTAVMVMMKFGINMDGHPAMKKMVRGCMEETAMTSSRTVTTTLTDYLWLDKATRISLILSG